MPSNKMWIDETYVFSSTAKVESLVTSKVMKQAQSLSLTSYIFKEGKLYVEYSPALDVSSCGTTEQKAHTNLIAAITLFLESAAKHGTLDTIMQEFALIKNKTPNWARQYQSISTKDLTIPQLDQLV